MNFKQLKKPKYVERNIASRVKSIEGSVNQINKYPAQRVRMQRARRSGVRGNCFGVSQGSAFRRP